MRDDATTVLPRRSAPTGPRSAGLRVVPETELAQVIRLPRGRRATSPSVGLAARPPVLVVLPDPAPVVDADPEASLSIQDRVRLRALEAAARS